MVNLKFAIFGTGFWSHYQLAGWNELEGVECVAVFNRTKEKAEKFAKKFKIPTVYDNADELLDKEKLDFVDIITDVDTHSQFVNLVAERKLPVICQKPMAPNLDTAEQMVQKCKDEGVPFFIHENFRWQTPIRELKKILDSGAIGTPFRAQVDMISGFPVFVNQPFLADLEEFIITDLGSHILDVPRYLFGDVDRLYCQTHHVHRDIKKENVKGEDCATMILSIENKMTVTCKMAYAQNYLEKEYFPETFVLIEADKGSLELAPDSTIKVTTKNGTLSQKYQPPVYSWCDPAYAIAQSSIVGCNNDFLQALQNNTLPETNGEDNIKTVRLVFGSYQSAKTGETVKFDVT